MTWVFYYQFKMKQYCLSFKFILHLNDVFKKKYSLNTVFKRRIFEKLCHPMAYESNRA